MDDITEERRLDLGRRVAEERERQFGTKVRAYHQASLNSATWDRIEAGQRVRDDRLRAALRLLWPESQGDWRKVFAPDPVPTDPIEAMLQRAGRPAPLTGLEGYLHQLVLRIEDLEDRVDLLEGRESHGPRDAATTSRAGESPAAGEPREGMRALRRQSRPWSRPPTTASPQRPDAPGTEGPNG